MAQHLAQTVDSTQQKNITMEENKENKEAAFTDQELKKSQVMQEKMANVCVVCFKVLHPTKTSADTSWKML